MAAQGLLNNPAMFLGYEHTPVQCIKDWLEICSSLGIHFTCFHNHLIYMLAKVFTRTEKRIFNSLKTKNSVIDYLQNYFNHNEEINSFTETFLQ